MPGKSAVENLPFLLKVTNILSGRVTVSIGGGSAQ